MGYNVPFIVLQMISDEVDYGDSGKLDEGGLQKVIRFCRQGEITELEQGFIEADERYGGHRTPH